MTRWDDLTAEEQEECMNGRAIERTEAFYEACRAADRENCRLEHIRYYDWMALCFMAGYEAARRTTKGTT